MKKKMLTAVLSVALVQTVSAQGFLQKLQQKMQAAQSGQSGGGAAANDGGFNQICRGALGSSFKEKKLAAGPEAVVGKYFKVTPDLDKLLLEGIDQQHAGSIVSLKYHVDDFKDKVIKSLAESFVANPSVQVLAQVVQYAESGDGYAPENQPSELAEAQTLLAMTMMQYPALTANNGYVNQLLRQAESKGSGLGRTLLARNYLFGDYAARDINSFSGYIAQAQKHYPVKLADQSIFFALNKIPNWQYRKQYMDLLQQSQQMQQSFQRQQNAAKSSGTNMRAIALMREGEKIDQLTMEALGAGPKMAELRAKGEMLRKEGSGEANLISVEANQSESYKAEVLKLMSANPQLDAEAKGKLEKANKMKMDNLAAMQGLTFEVALKFFSGDMGETINSGSMINKYFRNACSVASRQMELSKQSGIPAPQVDPSKMAQSL